jgi:hypothetical protein
MATMHGRARFVGSLVNRTNTCGGINKSGLPSKIGAVANRMVLSCNKSCNVVPNTCDVKKTVRFVYKAGRKYLG